MGSGYYEYTASLPSRPGYLGPSSRVCHQPEGHLPHEAIAPDWVFPFVCCAPAGCIRLSVVAAWRPAELWARQAGLILGFCRSGSHNFSTFFMSPMFGLRSCRSILVGGDGNESVHVEERGRSPL